MECYIGEHARKFNHSKDSEEKKLYRELFNGVFKKKVINFAKLHQIPDDEIKLLFKKDIWFDINIRRDKYFHFLALTNQIPNKDKPTETWEYFRSKSDVNKYKKLLLSAINTIDDMISLKAKTEQKKAEIG